MSKHRCHYVLSTHWDREWYMTFQDFRFRLVQLVDRILEGLADGRLAGPFQTDGQAILLEDYLEIRPERRAEIERLAREGQLVIGPWYALPDEFLVSGESLVRNLRLGRDTARAVGGQPSNAGFMCDMFGHNSQMPQIFAGLGIVGALVWRGSNQIENRHLIWVAPDGTELPTYRFGEMGYCSYAAAMRRYFDGESAFDADRARAALADYIQQEIAHTDLDPILLFDGCDHREWDQDVYPLVRERIANPDDEVEVVHSSLDAYLADMLAQAERIAARWTGELREPGKLGTDLDNQWLIPGVLSSRVWIKQDNAACETLLCQWAEPLSAYAHAALGREYPEGYLNCAWRWLITNHPHDSICGCSIDAVHEDMKYRFAQCRGIADRVAEEAVRRLGASVEGDISDDELRVVVFNPLPRPVDETVELTLQIPVYWHKFNEFFGYEPKPGFRVFDAQGRELPYQRLAQTMGQPKLRVQDWRLHEGYRTDDVRISLPLALPAGGYTTLTVRAAPKGVPTRYPAAPALATSERSMQNEVLAVTIENNGTLTITDKRSNQTYSRLLTFEDTADIGDGWYHGMAVNDQTFVSSAAHADVALVHNGPQLATFRMRTTMGVPAEFEFDSGMRRSPEIVPLVVDSLVSLRPGADRLEVETTVTNTADDHRLRVLLPSGAPAETYLADSQFDVVERPIALRADNHLYRELEVEPKSQQSWTAVFAQGRGLAIVAPGLLETAVRDTPERILALTLFRGTRRTVGTTGEPEGQLRGTLRFRYWIVPLADTPDRARLCDLGQRLAAGLRAAQLAQKDITYLRSEQCLPPEASFLKVEAPAVVTSARMVSGGLEVRVFNPLDEAAEVGLTWGLGQSYRTVQFVNLESCPVSEPEPLEACQFRWTLGGKKIVTLRLV